MCALLAWSTGCCAPDRSPAKGTDAGVVDAGAPDAGAPDAALPDAGFDAARPDAGTVAVRATGRFFDHPDRPIRDALANEAIDEVERGGGGRSLGFRITLADGTRAYFKPAQSFSGMSWHAELVAFHLDRQLGLGRVAPSIGRRVEWSALEAAAGEDARIEELEIVDGELVGALIWWVPEHLRALELPDGWERWLRIDEDFPIVSPFMQANAYRTALAALDDETPAREVPDAPEPDRADRPSELSDMIVFDYLIHNGDRWSANRANLRTLEHGGPLMYLDNAAGFTLRRPRTALMDARLGCTQRFRRSTIEAVRRLSMRRFTARLDDDPLAPLLDEEQLEGFEERRAHLLAYVDGLVERFGEDRVYAW
ncbi:MAG: hypothetical protein H6719_22815 [Sandaracinaceae bacterium]|nr:hypothetical protein [Sandaracinaceae bacterium]